MPRFAAQRDRNERQVFDLLRAAGYVIWPIDRPCDALAAKWGRTHLIEVKNPARVSKKNPAKALTAEQVRFRQVWRGPDPKRPKGCIHTGTSGEELLELLQRCGVRDA